MMNTAIIIDLANERFGIYEIKHKDHKRRIIDALDWWNKYVIQQEDKNKFQDAVVKVNGVDCICIGNDLRGIPIFKAEFTFRPCMATEDAGSGAGMDQKISF